MKEKTSGVAECFVPYSDKLKTATEVLGIQLKQFALQNYRKNRENGTDADNPEWSFPCDGSDWLINGEKSGSNCLYVKQYFEGAQDKAWMEEKDRNYLLRLAKEGTLQQEEPEEYNKILNMKEPSNLYNMIIEQQQQQKQQAKPENEEKKEVKKTDGQSLEKPKTNSGKSWEVKIFSVPRKHSNDSLSEESEKQGEVLCTC